uniref:Ig-like domain-containing protein n=1 Tax=Maylandia zebra TaxID=106582 RepID=A0A3P9AWZ2_9CICH
NVLLLCDLLLLLKVPLRVIGGSVTVEQGGTAILTCHVIDTNDDLTQITWQRKTREKPRNDNFLTILPRDGVQFLSNVALKDEGSYTCIFTMFPSGNQKTEIPLNLVSVNKNILFMCWNVQKIGLNVKLIYSTQRMLHIIKFLLDA